MDDLIWYEKWLLNLLCHVAGPHGEFIVGDMLEELAVEGINTQARRVILIVQNILLLSLHHVKSATAPRLLIYLLLAQGVYFVVGLTGQVTFLSHAYSSNVSILSVEAFYWTYLIIEAAALFVSILLFRLLMPFEIWKTYETSLTRIFAVLVFIQGIIFWMKAPTDSLVRYGCCGLS